VRIALTSDLHVDHHADVVPFVAERVAALRPDVLVVAGDLTADEARLEAALAALARVAPRTLFVAGNHDLWCHRDGAVTSRARYEEIIPARARAAGVTALGREPLVIDGVGFAGVTGWYDYSLREPTLDAQFTLDDYRRGRAGRLRWNDKLFVSWPDDDGRLLSDEEICAGQVASLEAQLDAIGSATPTVVVTHHLSHRALVTNYAQLIAGLPSEIRMRREVGEPPWDFLNGFMGSARLGEVALARPSVRALLAGHTHFRKSAVLDGAAGAVVAEVSPIGYPREYKRQGRDLAARVVERVTLIELA
jgi:3',5'-cyclic AMP phosphodiesterase CpdA